MTTEERSNLGETSASPVNSSPVELPLAERDEPVTPPGMTVAESQEFRTRAATVVGQLEEASGGKEMELVDSLAVLGTQAQRQAGTELELLRTRVGDMLAGGGTGRKISQDLVDLRLVLDQINPHELNRSGIRGVINAIPVANRLNSVVTVLKKVAIRYETVSKQIRGVEARLRDGRVMLARDNIELRKLYEQVEAQQLVILKNAYLGEHLIQQLEEILERIEDSPKAARVRDALYDVSIRVQNLKAMAEVHMQLFAAIELTRRNNIRLGQSVDQILTLATNAVMVGLALQAALARQKRVLVAAQRTRKFIGDLLVANAASVKQHTTEIGDIYNSPVVAIEKLTQAHNDLIEAMNLVDQLKIEGIDAAHQNIAKLNQLSGELREKMEGLSAPPATGSPEA